MTDQPGKRFSFVSNALPADTFTVVRFRGEEGLSRCYRFEIELAAPEAELDLESILRMPATLVVHRPEGDVPFHGILAEFRQSHQAGAYTFYQAVLVPRLWWLSLTHHNQVFLDQTMPQIVEACLQDGGLTTDDYESRFQNIFPSWEYVCHYRESHLAFVSRWMERGGVYFYFEQGESAEKVVLTDTKVSHTAMPEGETLRYRALAAMEHFHREEVIWGFECRRHLLPQSLLLKDYNCNTPSLDLSARTPVSPNGRGEWYLYGENFLTPEEGQILAQARAEELLCREQQFTGESAIPFLRPGYTFQLLDHYRDSFNQQYLTVALEHEGSQAAYLLAGLGIPLAPGEEEPYYRNRFTAIPASVQFRPERKTEKARFFGFMNAKVDAAGSGQYAELDELGRYKVVLPFDLSGRKDGKASAWLRMMQPYAGSDHGMHFPLHKGTEVLLAFIDGDPDRPVIAGAVPNPATPSPVTGDNQTMAVLQTGGKNRIAMEDKEGSQRILLQTPVADSWIRLGAPNDPVAPDPTPTPTRPSPPTPTPSLSSSPTPTDKEEDDYHHTEDGIYVYTNGPWHLVGAKADVQILGESVEFILGLSQIVVCGNECYVKLLSNFDITAGLDVDAKFGGGFEFTTFHHTFFEEKTELGIVKTELRERTNRMVGRMMEMVGDNTKMIGENTRMIGEHQVLLGQVAEASGTVDQLHGRLLTGGGQEIKTYGDRLINAGTSTEIAGNVVRTAGEDTHVVMDQMNSALSSTESAVEYTRIASEMTSLSALNQMI